MLLQIRILVYTSLKLEVKYHLLFPMDIGILTAKTAALGVNLPFS